MNSVVCWLDLSPEDMRRAGEFLEVMQGHGTKDELGFLAMQRAFANRFYPATTTQLSLARYFYFLPAIYESLERQHVSSAQSRRFIRDRQEELRRALKENDGIRYRERAVTLPSDVYWSALGALGFPRSPGWSEAGYLGALDAAYRGNRPWHDDDKVTRTGRTLGFWDPDRPDSSFLTANGVIHPKTDSTLRLAEARDLRRRFDGLSPNLLSHLIQRGERNSRIRYEWAWDIPDPPASLRPLLPAARRLSRFARGTMLQYDHRLAESRLEGKVKKQVQGAVEREWSSWYEDARNDLRGWDLDEFLELRPVQEVLDNAKNGTLEGFIRDWVGRFRKVTGPRLLHDSEARRLVQEREQGCKGGRSRFLDPLAMQNWNRLRADQSDDDEPVTQQFQLGFRHRVGTSIAVEICGALPMRRRS